MPIFQLSKTLVFPKPEWANKDGLLAIGGDLSIDRLLLAYSKGIFPWYSENDPILWWCPDPRFVLFPQNVNISRSMSKLLRKNIYTVTYDTCFEEVVTMCAKLRENNTWIFPEIIESYINLHKEGYAHSVETWFERKLVGGLYGVSLGKCFFGESMFSTMNNASKVALINLSQNLAEKNFLFLDCQIYSAHLESMGAGNISRKRFLELLKRGLIGEQTIRGNWGGGVF